jgi:hypothetical protein
MKKNHNKTGKETKDELSAVYSNLEVVGEEGKFIKLISPKGDLIIEDKSPKKSVSLFEDDEIEKKPKMYQGESILNNSKDSILEKGQKTSKIKKNRKRRRKH